MNHQDNETTPTPLHQSAFQQLAKSRIVWLNGEVNDESAVGASAEIMLLSERDPEADIYLYINSPGGSVTAGMALHDTMMMVPNDIVTVGMGMAASMGQFLLTAGAPGKRFASPGLRILLHQPLGGVGGPATNMQIEAELIEDMKVTLASITAKNAGRTVQEVIKSGDRDHWFNSTQALEFGFVDHILTNFTDITTLAAKGKK